MSQTTINIKGSLLDLSEPRIMGILNVTPDSFFAGSRISHSEDLLRKAEGMIEDGATILDVGGYSSRPGADDIDVEEEIRRVTTTIEQLSKNFPEMIISVDTFRSQVASSAVVCGAHMINDISCGELDSEMLPTISKLGVPYIGMHMRGTPQTMKGLTEYKDLMKEIMDYFAAKLDQIRNFGIKDFIIDPGFGFAKTIDQNFEILKHLDFFKELGRPILVGLSRKSMIYKTLDVSPELALNGTTALNTVALLKGASILRVHDVKEATEVVNLIKRITN